METVSRICIKLEKVMSRKGVPVLPRLARGLPVAMVEAQLKKVASPPPPVVELYGWKNGTEGNDGLMGHRFFVPPYEFESLENATKLLGVLKPVRYWKRTWLPAFSSGADFLYGIDLASADAAVIALRQGESPQLEYASLVDFLSAVLECYEADVYFLDPDGFLDSNEKAALKIHNKWRVAVARRPR